MLVSAPRIHEASPTRGPTIDDQWRAIILFGRNVASYKFALAKALLDLKPAAGALVKLEDLALPFALHVCEHLRLEDKQATSATSAFLDGCRKFNLKELDETGLASLAESRGFSNVIDAFHVVGQAETPERFFLDERRGGRGIRITDTFEALLSQQQASDLPLEAEARWRLVETAWRLGLGRALVVSHDTAGGNLLLPDASRRRTAVTSSRDALNGYQQGRCFYCSRPISLCHRETLADVDHFFPHVLKQFGFGPIVDGVWNLVLACQPCNRGQGGKFDRLPSLRLLARLHARNEHLIVSHHPLRETLILQTGQTEPARRSWLADAHQRAWASLIHVWEPA